jgi:hypothetical protein
LSSCEKNTTVLLGKTDEVSLSEDVEVLHGRKKILGKPLVKDGETREVEGILTTVRIPGENPCYECDIRACARFLGRK